MIYKLGRLLMIICLILGMGLMLDQTRTYWSDPEVSAENLWRSGIVDIVLEDENGVVIGDTLFNQAVVDGQALTADFYIRNLGILPYLLDVGLKISADSNQTTLCSDLVIEAKYDSAVFYTGALTSFAFPGLVLASEPEHFSWEITLASEVNPGTRVCVFAIEVKAWQITSDGTWGYTDLETLGNSVYGEAAYTGPAVIINEVMWMGSDTSPEDEWIELRNMTNQDINIGQWVLLNARTSSGNTDIQISANSIIPAHGYFLVAMYSQTATNTNLNVVVDQVNNNMDLLDTGEQITLVDKDNNVIDATPLGFWSAGESTTYKRSMARLLNPGDGTIPANWYTTTHEDANNTTYWKIEGNNYGTPKGANL